jgi:hypothetical protein
MRKPARPSAVQAAAAVKMGPVATESTGWVRRLTADDEDEQIGDFPRDVGHRFRERLLGAVGRHRDHDHRNVPPPFGTRGRRGQMPRRQGDTLSSG